MKKEKKGGKLIIAVGAIAISISYAFLSKILEKNKDAVFLV